MLKRKQKVRQRNVRRRKQHHRTRPSQKGKRTGPKTVANRRVQSRRPVIRRPRVRRRQRSSRTYTMPPPHMWPMHLQPPWLVDYGKASPITPTTSPPMWIPAPGSFSDTTKPFAPAPQHQPNPKLNTPKPKKSSMHLDPVLQRYLQLHADEDRGVYLENRAGNLFRPNKTKHNQFALLIEQQVLQHYNLPPDLPRYSQVEFDKAWLDLGSFVIEQKDVMNFQTDIAQVLTDTWNEHKHYNHTNVDDNSKRKYITNDVGGAGNCFFMALSSSLFGSTEAWFALRLLVGIGFVKYQWNDRTHDRKKLVQRFSDEFLYRRIWNDNMDLIGLRLVSNIFVCVKTERYSTLYTGHQNLQEALAEANGVWGLLYFENNHYFVITGVQVASP
jgi:hypothetical protein